MDYYRNRQCGKKSDPQAKALFSTAIKSPLIYRRIDWLDKSEGTLPNLDVDFLILARRPLSSALMVAAQHRHIRRWRPHQAPERASEGSLRAILLPSSLRCLRRLHLFLQPSISSTRFSLRI